MNAALEREAARQAVGRLTDRDALALAEEAYDLSPIDLRPTERAAMRGLVVRAHAAGLARRAA